MPAKLLPSLTSTAGLLLCVLLSLANAPLAQAQSDPDRYQLAEDLEVVRLTDDVWMHITWKAMPEWGRVRSNGLIVVSDGRALLINTAWGVEPTERLLDWISEALTATVDRAVVTHFHDDSVEGIAALKRASIPTYALDLTAEMVAAQAEPVPDSLFTREQVLPVGGRTVEVYFPGGGHTPDNVVVWLGRERMLFGGCLIRPAESQSMGNVADAVLEEWPETIQRLLARYADVEVVVPSHGPPGDDAGLLHHTLHLLDEHARQQPGG